MRDIGQATEHMRHSGTITMLLVVVIRHLSLLNKAQQFTTYKWTAIDTSFTTTASCTPRFSANHD
jgi:hypothetical protein